MVVGVGVVIGAGVGVGLGVGVEGCQRGWEVRFTMQLGRRFASEE